MSDRPKLYEKVRALPHTPGVYLYKDRFNRVIYVGKARDLHRRVSQYFMLSKRTRADRKTRALLEHIWDLETHSVRTEAESLLLEGKLIKEYRPRYNVSFRDDKKFLLVKINMNDPYPRFILTRMRKDDGYRYYGPFAHSGSLRKTLELIQKKFHLRTCHPQVPGEADYRHCLQHIIKNCSAPCMGHISQQEYRARAEQACQFIEGASKEVRDELEQEMKEAAAALDFEKAAELRNLIEDLRRTTKPTRRFHKQFAPNIEPSSDMAELQAALELPSLPDVIECFDISNISVTHKVASMVCFTDGKPDRKNYRRYRIKTVEGQDDFASMAEVVRRRYARVLKENYPQPKLIVVDGGKGQLGCARRELEELGLGSIPTIGLAKEREEIFRPGERDPIVLDHRTGGLRLLQRIRDEAHRTANGYHQLLMKQRINESILDDCPGISEGRKKLLLKHFGSVDRLKQATVEQICEIEGVGPKLAESVVEFFANLKKKPIVEEIPATEPAEVVEMREVPGSKGKLKMDANGQVIYRLR